jgi:hypothetical protein
MKNTKEITDEELMEIALKSMQAGFDRFKEFYNMSFNPNLDAETLGVWTLMEAEEKQKNNEV